MCGGCREGRLLSGSGSFKLTVEGDIGVLIETGVGFHARFGLGTAFEDPVIMEKETDTPLDTDKRMVVLKGVSLTLGFFDEFTVRYAGCGPVFGEVVSI